MAKFSPKVQEKVGEAMHKYKKGELTIGPKGPKVKSRQQAIRIGIEEGREAGGKAPKKTDS
jgi:hypothetical protein